MPVENEWVRVGKTAIGKGVFARQAIPKGTMIGMVEGKVIVDPDYATSYCIDLGGPLSLEPRAPFRFLNHCCRPNSLLNLLDCVYDDGTPAPAEVHVEVIDDIPEGAEVTIDYQWSAEGAIKCLCGSKECRGWVVASEELPLLLKRNAEKSSRPKTPRKAK